MFAKQSPSRSGIQRSSTNRRSAGSRVLIAALMVFGVLAVFALMIVQFGACTGEEFSPQRFGRRSFTFFRIPLINLQLTPAVRSNTTNSLELYLQRNGFVPPSDPNQPVTWDRVRFGTSRGPQWTGDASMLCAYLDLLDESGDLFWFEWTKAEPDLAKVLWPTVVELARQDEYYLIPELMTLGIGATDPQQLQARIHKQLIDSYQQQAQAQVQMGHHQAAADTFQRILAIHPKHNAAVVGLQNAHQALGAAAEAAQE